MKGLKNVATIVIGIGAIFEATVQLVKYVGGEINKARIDRGRARKRAKYDRKLDGLVSTFKKRNR